MKKTFRLMGILLIAGLLGFVLSCDEGSGDCDHNWNWASYASGSGLRLCQNVDCAETAGIGDTGPAGGIIFYSTEFDFFTGTTAGDTTTVKRYYLEAAPANMETTLAWATGTDWNDETDWLIGRGRLNTAVIIARGIDKEYTTPAASACADLRTGDKDDWFLPSINELNALAQIREQHGIPNEDWYWSSSQYDNNLTWSQDFNYGNQYGTNKNASGDVRPIRAF